MHQPVEMRQGAAAFEKTEVRRDSLGPILQLARKQESSHIAVQHVAGGAKSVAILQQEQHRVLRILLRRSRRKFGAAREGRLQKSCAPFSGLAVAPLPNR